MDDLTYSISHKKVKVPYRTRTVVLANLECTSSVPLIAQRTHSSVRFGTLRFSAVRSAVRYDGCDTRIPTRDRSRTGSRTAQQHVASLFVGVNNFVDRVTTLREIENACQ